MGDIVVISEVQYQRALGRWNKRKAYYKSLIKKRPLHSDPNSSSLDIDVKDSSSESSSSNCSSVEDSEDDVDARFYRVFNVERAENVLHLAFEENSDSILK